MRVAAALAFILGFAANVVGAEGAPRSSAPGLEPGVTRELAQWRAQRYHDVRYALKLSIFPGARTLRGTAQIEVALPRSATELVLDWRPASGARAWGIRVNGKAVKARFEHEHLIVPARLLRTGKNRLSLRFESPIAPSGSAVTRYRDREDGSEYVYTLLVPSDASSVFPCFDQPDLKARFRLDLAVPGAWTAVSNAPVVRTEKAPGGARRIHFAETRPISTYLFAFAAGPFAELAESAGQTRLLVRKSQLARARKDSTEVLRLNHEAVKWLSQYFDFAFPFAKYDLVLIPELPYGGMEHAGATFLREEAVLFPSAPNETDILQRAELVFHETSHQWFGDLVTMRWFDDLWLKEGFATFMAAKTAEAVLPGQSAWNAFHALKAAAYRTDITQGTTAVYQPLSNLSAAKSAYGSIVYGKAPALLRQAEFYVGEPAFRRAVRQLLKKHAYGVADWSDLVAALERASGRGLEAWAETWVKGRGMPEVRLSWSTGADGKVSEASLEQRDALGEGRVWPMKIRVFASPANGPPRVFDAALRGARTRLPEMDGMSGIEFVFANFGDYGYGRFPLDTASQAAVLARPQIVQGELLRSLVFDSLWESVRDAEVAPLDYIDLVVRVAPAERDPVTLSGLLARLQVAFLHYLSDAQRDAAAPRLEAFLSEAMLGADSPGRRISFFRAFTATAWSEPGRARLKALLANGIEIPGVKLTSRDRFRVIARLLTLDDPDARALLAIQSAADPSEDGGRYAFAAGAAERSTEVKREYFERFLSDSALAENWADAALFPFNAVEHADLTAPFLDLALAALPALQSARKIFFVNDWLTAFVGGQVDASSLDQVERFAREPTLDPILKLKVLEAMDGLARTVRIRARFAS